MESAKASLRINYVIHTKLVKVEERFHRVHHHVAGADAVFDKCSLGWYAWFEGSYESIFVGEHRPADWQSGDKFKITFERQP